jgi:hypothetical protein
MTDTMTNLKNGLCPDCGKTHTLTMAEIESAIVASLAEYGPDGPAGVVCDPCFLRQVCAGDADYFFELLNRKPVDLSKP